MPGVKRSVADVPIFLDKVFNDLNTFLGATGWNYKEDWETFELRDKSLFSLLVLTGGRASECGIVRKRQVNEGPAGVTIANFVTVKNGLLRKEIILPRTGALGIYTEVVLEWLKELPEPDSCLVTKGLPRGGFIWNQGLKRGRIWEIMKARTGLFPHWFRGVHETVYGRLIFRGDAWNLKEHMGLKRVDSTGPYVKGQLGPEDLKRLKSL